MRSSIPAIRMVLLLAAIAILPAAGQAAGFDGELFGGFGMSGEPNDDDPTGHYILGGGFRVSEAATVGLELLIHQTHGDDGYRYRTHGNAYGRFELLPGRFFDPYARVGLGLADFSRAGDSTGVMLTAGGGIELGTRLFGVFAEAMLVKSGEDGLYAFTVGVRLR